MVNILNNDNLHFHENSKARKKTKTNSKLKTGSTQKTAKSVRTDSVNSQNNVIPIADRAVAGYIKSQNPLKISAENPDIKLAKNHQEPAEKIKNANLKLIDLVKKAEGKFDFKGALTKIKELAIKESQRDLSGLKEFEVKPEEIQYLPAAAKVEYLQEKRLRNSVSRKY